MKTDHSKYAGAFLTERKGFIILIVLWAAVQAYLLFTKGINLSGESGRMIREANSLVQGKGLTAGSYYLYFTEILLISLSMKIGAGYGFVVAVQMALNLFALRCFYKFLFRFYLSVPLAFTGALLLLACIYYQLYNVFLYTESVFFSLSVIYSCYLLSIKKMHTTQVISLLLLTLLLCMTRPSGIFFMGATILYLFFFLSRSLNPFVKTGIFIGLSAIGLFLLNRLMGAGGQIDILLPFRDERVICDVPTLPQAVSINTDGNGNSLYGLFYYITHNFSQFSRLAILKSKAFFGLTRPYYGTAHNSFLMLYFYTLYILILITIIKINKKLPVAFVYFISLILIYWLSVVFSCDEWHNRFFLGLVPFFIAPALYLFSGKQSPKPVHGV